MALLTIVMVVNTDPIPVPFGIRTQPVHYVVQSDSSGTTVNYYWS